jgi:hypothetical protein
VTRLLLRLLTVTFSPIDEHTPPDNFTASAVTFINRWEADKLELLAALEDICLPAFEVRPSQKEFNNFFYNPTYRGFHRIPLYARTLPGLVAWTISLF